MYHTLQFKLITLKLSAQSFQKCLFLYFEIPCNIYNTGPDYRNVAQYMPNLYMLIINTTDLDFLLKSTSHVCLLCHSSNELCQEKLGQIDHDNIVFNFKLINTSVEIFQPAFCTGWMEELIVSSFRTWKVDIVKFLPPQLAKNFKILGSMDSIYTTQPGINRKFHL